MRFMGTKRDHKTGLFSPESLIFNWLEDFCARDALFGAIFFPNP